MTLNLFGVAFLVFGIVAIGAIVYWSVTGAREEKKQQKQSHHNNASDHDHTHGHDPHSH